MGKRLPNDMPNDMPRGGGGNGNEGEVGCWLCAMNICRDASDYWRQRWALSGTDGSRRSSEQHPMDEDSEYFELLSICVQVLSWNLCPPEVNYAFCNVRICVALGPKKARKTSADKTSSGHPSHRSSQPGIVGKSFTLFGFQR